MAEEHAAVGAKKPNYYLVWLYLLILTIAEVGVAFVSHLPDAWLILILLFLAVWKAALVAMYYMHLKNDSKLFSGVFVFPIIIAAVIIVGLIVLQTYHWAFATSGG